MWSNDHGTMAGARSAQDTAVPRILSILEFRRAPQGPGHTFSVASTPALRLTTTRALSESSPPLQGLVPGLSNLHPSSKHHLLQKASLCLVLKYSPSPAFLSYQYLSLLEIIFFYLYLVLAYIPLIPHTANMNLLFIYAISIYVLVNTLGDWYLAVNKKAKITTYIELTFL